MHLKSKVAFNTVLQLVEKLLVYGIGFITISLIAHHFSVNGYGKYSTANNYINFFALFADWGVGLIVSRDLLRFSEIEQQKFLKNAISFRLVLSIVIYGFCLLSLPFTHYSNDINIGIAILIISQLLLSLGQIYTSVSQIYLNTIGISIGELLGRLVSLALVISIVVLNLNIQFTFIAILVSNAILIITTYLFIRSRVPFTLAFDKQIWLQLLKDSLPIGFAGILATIYFKVDSVLLSFMKSTIEVGIYSLPYKLLEILLVFPSLFLGLVMPQMAKSFHEDNMKRLIALSERSLELMFMLAMPITFGTILIASKLIALVGGKSFATQIPITFFKWHFMGNATLSLQILSIAVGISFLANVFGYLQIAVNGQRQAVWKNLIIALFNIISNLLIIPSLTFIGTSITTVLSELLTAILTYYIVNKILKVRIHIPHAIEIIGATIGMCCLIVLLRNFNLLIILPLSGIVYFGILYVTKTITKNEIIELLQLKNA